MSNAPIGRLLNAVVLTLALGACTGDGVVLDRRTSAPTDTIASTSDRPVDHPTGARRSVVPTTGPDGSPIASDKPFCRTSIPAAWKVAKVHDPWETVTMSRHGSLRWVRPRLLWVGADGLAVGVTTFPASGGLGMAWNVGKHIAYYDARSEQNWGDWQLFLWDSAKRHTPVTLDKSDGEVPNAPFLLVTTNDTQLAWLHPLKDGRREVRVHDVTTGRTRVAHVGHEGAPFFAGDLLVWPEAFAPDTPTRLVAVDRKSFKPAALPRALAELRDPQEMSTDGRTYAWATKDRTRLMVWQKGWPTPRVVVKNALDNPVTWPKVSGDTVSWVSERTYTADLRSNSYAPMTRQWGGAEVWGTFLHIGYPKGAGRSYHLDTSKLPPLPRCR